MLWDGRFAKGLDQRVLGFTSSLELDKALYEHDIKGSIAHIKSLEDIGIVSKKETKTIINNLGIIKRELDKATFVFKKDDEDIHMAIERRLIELIGDTGKKLHTGRSRNDQVSLDMRMYLKDIMKHIIQEIELFQTTLRTAAKKNIDVILPGYTHLQQAQPVLFSHYLLAYCSMLERDKARFQEAYNRCDMMPLGAGALAGTPYLIDRKKLAKELGFKDITKNSMDTVSDRDFILDFLYASSVFVIHCTRLAEDLIIYSTQEFGFIELDDAFCTGSSIMPQKKNPDVLELARGRSERVIGALNSFLNVTKALPLTYNRDLQEDKYYLFTSVEVVLDYIYILPKIISSMKVQKKKMKNALDKGYLYATAIADYLVKNKVPFREAHYITGRVVQYALKKNKTFQELTIGEFKDISGVFNEDIYYIFNAEKIINEQRIAGGTSKISVERQLNKKLEK